MDFPALQKTSLWESLSDLGKRISTPPGVLVWGARAEKEVKKDPATLNATVGISMDDGGIVSHLSAAEEFMGPAFLRIPKGKVFGYAPIPGLLSLRQKWKSHIIKQWTTLENHITDSVVTGGITHALYIAGQLFLNHGETIIFPEKSWENYAHIFETVLGLNIQTFSLFREGKLNTQNILDTCETAARNQKKVVLLLNFPHNQTGFTPSTEEILELSKGLHELCKKYSEVPFVVLLDDAYEGYVYDESGQKYSMCGQIFVRLPNLSVVKLDGGSKKLLLYGSRVGFLTAFINRRDGGEISADESLGISKEWTSKVGGLIRAEISQVNHHGQAVMDALLENPEGVETERGKIIATLSRRYAAMMAAIKDQETRFGTAKLRADPCNSGFFAFLNTAPEISPTALVEKIIEQERVVVFPAESDGGLRVAFCSVKEADILRVIEKIYRVANALFF